MTVSGGYLIKTHGVNWVMWLPMLMIVACLAMLRLLPRAARPAPDAAPATPGVTPMRAVLRDRPLPAHRRRLAGAGQQRLPVFYSTLHWTAQGLSTALISLLWVVGVASEVLFFAAPKVLGASARG